MPDVVNNPSQRLSFEGIRRSLILAAATLMLAACGGDESSSTPLVTVPITPTPSPPTPMPTSTLLSAARAFPAMPRDTVELLQRRGGTSVTFGSGTPFNDLEYTAFDTDYMEGETTGFDTFLPVDPSRSVPGENEIKLINAVNNVDLDFTYAGQRGDRIILGTAEIASPFFLRGTDGADNDFVVITNFDYTSGYIQLRGASSDYGLLSCTLADGCASDGYFLFHTAGTQPDLIAFIARCDALALPISGSAPRNPLALCNSSRQLSLNDPAQFRYATPVLATPALAANAIQFGTTGREVVGGVTTDPAGNTYVVGASDGNLDVQASADNEIFVTRTNADGTQDWAREIALANGSLFFDAIADAEHVYAVGRTLSALPGFTNAGRWDGIIVKIRTSDGSIAAMTQFGNEGLDGFGNVILDDAGNLFVSGAGSPPGPAGTDPNHLVAKYRASDLSRVWTQIVAPNATGQIFVAEAWGGLSYVPGATPGDGRLVAGGWYMSAGGANGFLEVWEGLNTAAPTRTATTTIASPNNQADWVLDNVVDANGNVYAVGFTTGSLAGTARGAGDAYIVRYDRNLANPIFVQLGTAQSDSFRRLRIDASDNLYAVGYSYGDFARPNASSTRESGDIILQKFDRNLNVLGALQFGTPQEERGYLDLRGSSLTIGGMTEAALGRTSAGSFDVFIARVDATTMQLRPR
jgi:hypothetical protein